MTEPGTATKRERLTRDKVIDGALGLADKVGMGGFTIRKLATALDVKPMTIYHHIANKEAIIDAMVDRIFGKIDLPPTDLEWKPAIRQRMWSARQVLAIHPWAAPLMESRTAPGPAVMTHHDAVLGCFRNAGFSLAMTGHAYALLDCYLYGFALEEANLPATTAEGLADVAATNILPMLDGYPHLAEFSTEYAFKPGYDFRSEFEFGLELILDGLEAAHSRQHG